MGTSKQEMLPNSPLDSMIATKHLTINLEESVSDPLIKHNRLYFIFIVLGALLSFIFTVQTITSAVVGALFGLVGALFTKQGIALVKLLRFNHTDYSLPAVVTKKELLEYLQEHFYHPDIQVNKSLLGGITFTYRSKTDHVISIDEKRNSFWIHSRMTKGARLKRGGKENSVTVYKNAIYVVPAIRKLIEEAALSIHNSR